MEEVLGGLLSDKSRKGFWGAFTAALQYEVDRGRFPAGLPPVNLGLCRFLTDRSVGKGTEFLVGAMSAASLLSGVRLNPKTLLSARIGKRWLDFHTETGSWYVSDEEFRVRV